MCVCGGGGSVGGGRQLWWTGFHLSILTLGTYSTDQLPNMTSISSNHLRTEELWFSVTNFNQNTHSAKLQSEQEGHDVVLDLQISTILIFHKKKLWLQNACLFLIPGVVPQIEDHRVLWGKLSHLPWNGRTLPENILMVTKSVLDVKMIRFGIWTRVPYFYCSDCLSL